MSDSAIPGWYHAQGDPPGTERYWDGTAWTEGPRPVGGVSETPAPEAAAAPDMPDTSGFGSTTPDTSGFGSTTPDTSGFGTTAPDSASPGGFTSETPSAGGAFGAPASTTPSSLPPQDGFGAPRAAPGGTPVQPGFPGAPVGAGGVGGFYPEESKATAALIVAILGTILCGPPGIIGLFMGNSERKAIAAGRRDPAGQGKAVAAMVIGGLALIGTLVFLLAMVAVLALGSTA